MTNLPAHVHIKRSARAKRVALRLDPIERVFHLVVPKRMNIKRAEKFAESQESWMQEKLAELAPQIRFEDGAIIPILGTHTTIRIHHEAELKVTKIDLEAGVLHVRTNKDDPSGRITRFLKKLAKEELAILSHEKAALICKKISRVTVRDTKSRWGSCSCDGNLSYSWRLIFASPEAFDYVVAHEVAHLKHLNHSKAFWDVCAQLSQNYEEGKYWMKAHGGELMRYG